MYSPIVWCLKACVLKVNDWNSVNMWGRYSEKEVLNESIYMGCLTF